MRLSVILTLVIKSDDVGDHDLDSDLEAGPKPLARVLFDRIGNIERSRLQTRFLLSLSALPIWNQIVFRGATSIHGIWLHGRCSRDLDFLAPPDIKRRFLQIMSDQGLHLQTTEESTMPFLSMQGTIFKEIAIGVDVCERESRDMNPIRAVFTGAGDVSIPVNVMPLPASMAEKLRATSRRAQPSDFFDLWLFVQKHPEMIPQLRRHLHIGEVDGEELEYSSEKTWAHLIEAENLWYNGLAPYIPVSRIPPFEKVRRDLRVFIDTLPQ